MTEYAQKIRVNRVQEPKVRIRIKPRIPPLEIEMQNTGAMVQWRVGTTGTWQDLIPIDDINASVAIGEVETLPAGTPAYVTNVGTDQDVILNIGIPAGADGQVVDITGGEGIAVDSADPAHPVVAIESYVATRTALKALDTTKDTVAILTEAGREGTFIWRSGDYSTQITADPDEEVYIEAAAVAPAEGAWVRGLAGATGGNFWVDEDPPPRIIRLRDRLFIGDAVEYDGRFTRTKSTFVGDPAGLDYHWMERDAQLHVVHQRGGQAIVGATRTSDKDGVAGHTAIGVSAIAQADAATGSAWAMYAEAVREEDVDTAIFGMELTAKNRGDVVVNSAYNIFSAGHTIGLWLGAGGDPTFHPAANDSTAAIVIGRNGARWRKGIVFENDGLTGTDGDGTGTAVAMELARGQMIQWRHASTSSSTSGAIRSDNNSAAQESRIVFTLNGLSIRGMNSDQSAEVELFRVALNPTAVNFVTATATDSGVGPVLSASGADTNIDLRLAGKGTGGGQLRASSTTKFQWNSTGIGFFGATPIAKPTVVGSRGGNAALGDLIAHLANLGLVTNGTSS